MPYPCGLNLIAFSRYLGDDIEDRAPRPLTIYEEATIAAVTHVEQRIAEGLHLLRSMPHIDATDETADAREILAGVELDLGGILAQLRDVVRDLRMVPERECEE